MRSRRAGQPALLDELPRLGIERRDDPVVVHHVEDAAEEQRRRELRHAALILPADRLVAHVSRTAETDREHAVLGIERRAVIRPLVLRQRAVDVEIGDVEPERRRELRKFGFRQHAVAVGIGRFPHLVGGRHRHLLARIVHGRAVAVDVDGVAADDRRRLHLERQSTHPPQFFARRGVVGGEQKRPRDQDLILAVRPAPDDRRRVSALGFGPIDLPLHATGPLVHPHHERAQALIARQHDEIADDDRRGAHAVDVVEGAERHRPPLLAGAVVGNEPVVGEEHVDAVLFDRRTRRCGVVPLVDDLRLDLRRCALPENLPFSRSMAIVTSVSPRKAVR